MASRRQHRQDSSSTSPSSPSASIDSSSSSLDSCQGHLTNSNAPSRLGSQYQEGGVGELKLLNEETIKGDYQVTLSSCEVLDIIEITFYRSTISVPSPIQAQSEAPSQSQTTGCIFGRNKKRSLSSLMFLSASSLAWKRYNFFNIENL